LSTGIRNIFHHITLCGTDESNVNLGDEGDGSNMYLKCMEKYDQGSSRWYTMAPMHERRASFGCAAVGKFIYVMGGYDGTFWLKSVER
jgi:hypothetical protein